MDNLIEFPLRRICVLGVPAEIVANVRRALSHVSVSVDAATLQRADLLVISEDAPGALDTVAWVRRNSPRFPVLFWSDAVRPSVLAEHCRSLLWGTQGDLRLQCP